MTVEKHEAVSALKQMKLSVFSVNIQELCRFGILDLRGFMIVNKLMCTMVSRLLLLVFCFTLTGFGLLAQSLSGNWDTAGNWTPSGVPADNPNTDISLGGNGTLNGGNVHTIGNINATVVF